ncbi:MAG: hypothetical protein FWG98_07220 [Candidatus Cloacimonetes bacterium]|nr:hypothetical protein [Candidatus Cloacimonadota bacterium]
MKKALLLVLIALFVGSLFSFEYSGDFRTRYSWIFNWVDSEYESERFIDSRIRAQFEATPTDYLSVVFAVKAGDFIWGDDSESGIFSNRVNIKTQHLYADFTGIKRTSFKIGFLPWNDPLSLVLDDDFAGSFLRHEFCNEVSVEFGYGLLRNGHTALHDNWYGPDPHSYSEGADNALYFFGVDYLRDFGLQTIVNTYKYTPFRNRAYHLWAMPYITKEWRKVNLDAMFALNYSFIDRDVYAKNTQNIGMAFALDFEFKAGRAGTPAINILIATGDEGTDPENTTFFSTISSDFNNGLELFGNGFHDGSPQGYWLDPFNSGHGLMSAVFRYTVPLCQKISLRFAAGGLSAVERGRGDTRSSGNMMGAEGNLGFEIQLVKDFYIRLIGIYAQPYSYFGTNLDDIYGVHSTLDIKF